MSRSSFKPGLFCIVLLLVSCGDDAGVNNQDTIPPADIQDLQASSHSDGEITLIWTAPGDDGNSGTASQYKIGLSEQPISDSSWNHVPLFPGPPKPKPSGRIDAVDISGLDSNKVYYFAIKAVDEVGNHSGLSNIVHRVASPAGDTIPPAAITDLEVTAVTEQSIALAWTAPGDNGDVGIAQEYELRVRAGEEFEWRRAATVTNVPQPDSAGKRESMMVSGVASDTPYSFAVKASDEEDNWSELSNVVVATTLISTDSVPPSTISDLRVIDSDTSQLTLSWTAPGDDGNSGVAHQYDMRYAVGSSLTWEVGTLVAGIPSPHAAGTPETLIVPDLEEGTSYAFGVKTVDENNNWSELSNVVRPTTLFDTTPPDAVTDLRVTDSTHTSVTLTWTAPGDDGASGTAYLYSLRYSMSPIDETNWAAATEVTGVPAPQAPGSEETFTVTDLGSDTTYYFAIRTADDRMNWSPISDVVAIYLTHPVIWEKNIGGTGVDIANAVVILADGGIVIAGKTNSTGAGDYDGYVVKIDSDGDVVWEKTFGGPAEDVVIDLIATSDGGYAIAGHTSSGGAGGNDGWLVKLNSSGTKVWERTFGAENHDSFRDVLQTSDGGFFMAGNTGGRAIVVKTDAAGVKQWDSTYYRLSNCGPYTQYATSDGAVVMADGSIIMAWSASYDRAYGPNDCAPVTECLFTKLDPQHGEVYTRQVYAASFFSYVAWSAGTMVSTGSGSFAIVRLSSDVDRRFFESWNSEGDALWQQNAGHWLADPVSVVRLANRSFVPVGFTRGSTRQAWFGLVNSSGELIEQFLIGGDADDRFHAVAQAPDGSIIAVGYTLSFGESTDIYVVKIRP